MLIDSDERPQSIELEHELDLPSFPVGERLPRILLSEDDEGLRELLQETLARSGYEVQPVQDGFELLDLLEDERSADDVDLVVAEVNLPGLNAFEVLSRVRARRWFLPFLVLTPSADGFDPRARQLGATTLAKPFGRDDLLHAVARLVPQDMWELGRAA